MQKFYEFAWASGFTQVSWERLELESFETSMRNSHKKSHVCEQIPTKKSPLVKLNEWQLCWKSFEILKKSAQKNFNQFVMLMSMG